MPSVPPRMFRFSQGHFLLYIILKIKCVTQITFYYLDIIKYIFFDINAILDGIFKTKTPLNEWSLFISHLQIDLYTIFYTSIEYMIILFFFLY